MTTTGTPRRAARPTTGAVNGATTDMCACTTSNAARSRAPTSHAVRARRTRTGPRSWATRPSAAAGVEVSTVTSSPRAAWRAASEATWVSMPPSTGG